MPHHHDRPVSSVSEDSYNHSSVIPPGTGIAPQELRPSAASQRLLQQLKSGFSSAILLCTLFQSDPRVAAVPISQSMPTICHSVHMAISSFADFAMLFDSGILRLDVKEAEIKDLYQSLEDLPGKCISIYSAAFGKPLCNRASFANESLPARIRTRVLY